MIAKINSITIYTFWTCDVWLSTKSFCLEGIFSTKTKAIAAAKTQKLLQEGTHVVINKGILDNYDNTEQRVFCTQYNRDEQTAVCEPSTDGQAELTH